MYLNIQGYVRINTQGFYAIGWYVCACTASAHKPTNAGKPNCFTTNVNSEKGKQRLSVEQLGAWEKLAYGMLIHFGMSTFDDDEYSKGDKPADFYNPVNLDVSACSIYFAPNTAPINKLTKPVILVIWRY